MTPDVSHAVAFDCVCDPKSMRYAKKDLTNKIREYANRSKMKISEYEIGSKQYGPLYLLVVAIARGNIEARP